LDFSVNYSFLLLSAGSEQWLTRFHPSKMRTYYWSVTDVTYPDYLLPLLGEFTARTLADLSYVHISSSDKINIFTVYAKNFLL
jgi:hypothetical protein